MAGIINWVYGLIVLFVLFILLFIAEDVFKSVFRERRIQKHNLKQYYMNRTEQNFKLLTLKQRDKIQGEIVDRMCLDIYGEKPKRRIM